MLATKMVHCVLFFELFISFVLFWREMGDERACDYNYILAKDKNI